MRRGTEAQGTLLGRAGPGAKGGATPFRVSHLYLHVPFCTGRCAYCAFVSGPPPERPEAYVDTLLREAKARGVALGSLETLYCGGGTPALLGERGFVRLRESCLFSLSEGAEWTVELHPAAVTPGLVRTLADLGVTRLSLGVQALDDAVLARCNRRHTVRQALEALEIARAAIPDTGIDLIAGLPGVSPNLWRETLRRVAALGLPHLSVYALSVEPESVWGRQGLPPLDPDWLCDAVAEAHTTLAAVGLRRYETSNYALPGHVCRHNLNTWHGGDYLGLGRGAASRLGLTRRHGDGTEETLSVLDDALERSLTALRLDTGLDPEAAARRFPVLAPLLPRWRTLLGQARAHGLLDARNAPTPRGHEVLDALERMLLG